MYPRDTLCTPRDTILAYNTYKNQWTSSGKKKLVVDASKVGQIDSWELLAE